MKTCWLKSAKTQKRSELPPSSLKATICSKPSKKTSKPQIWAQT